MADPDSAKLALKRHLGELATLRGRTLAGPLPMLPLGGSASNDTAQQVLWLLAARHMLRESCQSCRSRQGALECLGTGQSD